MEADPRQGRHPHLAVREAPSDLVLDAWLSLPVVGGNSLSVSLTGTFIVFVYVWLPFMILPIQAALERVPANLIEASADLGATPRQTFRNVVFPLALPGIVAGSIFTFSLTLGDYIIPQIIGTSRLFIGQAVYAHQGTAGNIPLAAAFTVVPIVIMGLYLGRQAHGGVRCALIVDAHRAPLALKIARGGRPAVPAPADPADLRLRLHDRGEELPVAAARADDGMVRRHLESARCLGGADALGEGGVDLDG